MDQQKIVGLVAVVAVLLGLVVVVFAMPGPEPIERADRPDLRDKPEVERLATRVVTPRVERVAPAVPPPAGSGEAEEPSIPFEERAITDAPLPATYQGVRKLFKDHGAIVQRCLQEVAYPVIEAGEGPLPTRVGVVLTVQAVEGSDEGRLTGLEVTGDYERHFTGFSKCLAERFQSATFQAPPGGGVATLSWQQHVPRELPQP